LSTTEHPFLIAPSLQWRNDLPVSDDFDDPYFSKDNGLEETRHVFLQGTRLAERLKSHADAPSFKILETGFGTGLNFLATLAQWRATPENSRPDRLAFCSIESHPLTRKDMARALSPWRSELAEIDQLVEHFPPRLAGHYRIDFGDVELTLLFNDIRHALEQFVTPAPVFDALYLDGFAPSRNPQMWAYPVLERLAAVLKPGATAATFTAAGDVRRGLSQAGFVVQRVPGFGRKRDMVVAERTHKHVPAARDREPWFAPPSVDRPSRVAVIGAGLAGAGVARAVHDSGIDVTVYEAESHAAAQTSAVPHAGWHPHFTVNFNLRCQLMLHGHLATLNALDRLGLRNADWVDECGVYFAADRDDRVERLNRIAGQLADTGLDARFVDAQTAARATGLSIKHGGLLSDHGGCINTRRFCEALLEGIAVRYETPVAKLEPASPGWNVNGQQFDAVVLCTGGADNLTQAFGDFDVTRVRGQVDLIKTGDTLRDQKRLVCFKGYLTRPGPDGHHVTGATFDDDNDSPDTTLPAHDENRQRVARLLGIDVDSNSRLGEARGWVGWRRVSRDRLPAVGAVPDLSWFRDNLKPWTRGGAPGPAPVPRQHNGLYMSIAHGARGTSTAIICGEVIASMLCNEPLPLPKSLVHALHPARFAIRDLKKEPNYQD